MLSLLFQVGRLLKCERHATPSIPIPWTISSNELGIIGEALGPVNFMFILPWPSGPRRINGLRTPNVRSVEALLHPAARMPQDLLSRDDQPHHKHLE